MCPGLQLEPDPLIVRLVLDSLLGGDVGVLGQTQLSVFPQLEHVLTLPTAEVAVQILLDLVHKVPVKQLLLVRLGCLPALLADDLRLPDVELPHVMSVVVKIRELAITVNTRGHVTRTVLHVEHELFERLELEVTLATGLVHFVLHLLFLVLFFLGTVWDKSTHQICLLFFHAHAIQCDTIEIWKER